MIGYHKSVLLKETMEALIPTRLRSFGAPAGRDALYLDATLGDGGHSIEIIKRGGKVIGLDVDPQALERVKGRFGELERLGEFKLIQGNFRDIKNLLNQQTDTKDQKFAGVVFDLGVSSLQLLNPERGFSFGKDGPLDMRMDPSLQVKALDLVNALSRKELYELFKRLGEEKHSWALANSIVSAREVTRITTTSQLAGIVKKSSHGRGEIHPATRVFQALRIAVNDELGALQEGLDQVIDLLEKNGCIVVISFHSLEDRIVKNIFRDWGSRGMGEILTKKPIIPSDEEIRENPRSRSAKMRVFKK